VRSWSKDLARKSGVHCKASFTHDAVRIDASEERFEVLRRRFGGIGRSQTIEQWVRLRNVDLDPIQPRQILACESDPLTGGPHERSGGAQVTR